MALSKVDPNFLNVSQVGGKRNLVINGAMRVAQRGTSETGVTGNSYGADRFVLGGSSNLAVYTVENVSDAPANTGLKNSIKYTCTTGDTPSSTYYKETKYVIESGDCDVMEYGTSTAKTITLSFWVKSNVTGTFSFYAYNNVASPTLMYSLNYTINVAGTWERKIVTIPPDTANGFSTSPHGSGIRLYWPILAGPGYSSGTSSQARGVGWETIVNTNLMGGQTANISSVNDYWQMTGVQVEIGNITNPIFEHIPHADTFNLCQRYCQVIRNADYTNSSDAVLATLASWSATSAYGVFDYPGGRMRSQPSFSWSATNDFSAWSNSAFGDATAVSMTSVSPYKSEMKVDQSSVVTSGQAVWIRLQGGGTSGTQSYMYIESEL